MTPDWTGTSVNPVTVFSAKGGYIKTYTVGSDHSAVYTGKGDPDKIIPDMLKEMEKAGLRKVIDEIQTQLDDFKAKEN